MKKLIILLILFACFFPKISFSNHIVGGDLTYKHYKGNYYILTYKFYRDKAGPNIDTGFDYKIFKKSDGKAFGTYHITLKSLKDVNPYSPNCKSIVSSTSIQEGTFIDTVLLGSDTVGYDVVWMRGNRNAAITNLLKPNTVGSVWYTSIPATKYNNSSPQFLTTPLPFLCAGKKTTFTINIQDPENDSLVFTNETPIISPNNPGLSSLFPPPYTKATYNTGYNVFKPFGTASDSIKVDPTTGQITVNPSSSGNYVISIVVKDYRYDPVYKTYTYMGEIIRDYQFFVTNCSTSPLNKIPAFDKDTLGYSRTVSPDSTICFNVKGSDANGGDTVYLFATAGIFSNSLSAKSPFATFPGDTSYKGKYSGVTLPTAKSDFCWTPSCKQVTYTTPYVVTFSLADDKCELVEQNYKIYVKPRTIYNAPELKCVDVASKSQINLTFKPLSPLPTSGSYIYTKIFRARKGSSTFTLVDSLSSASATSWQDKTISDADTAYYTYYLRTENSCNVLGLPSDTVSSLVISATKVSNDIVRFNWNKNRRGTNFKYKFYLSKGGGYSLIDSSSNLYEYYQNCNATVSAIVTVESFGCKSGSISTPKVSLKDTTPPNINGKLLNVTVTSQTSNTITFAPSDSLDAKQYNLYVSTDGSTYTKQVVLSSTGATTYSYVHSGITPSKNKYYYYITAEDSCGNISLKSNLQSTSELKAVGTHLQVNLTWKKYLGYGVDTVQIEKWNGSSFVLLKNLSISDSSYKDNPLVCTKSYSYRIVYKSSSSAYASYSDTASAIALDTVAPSQVNIREVTFKNNINNIITFFKSSDADVKTYEVFCSTNGGSYSLLSKFNATTATISYTHTGINNSSNTYQYRVYALDTCAGNISKSSETHQGVNIIGKALPLKAKVSWNYYTGFSSVKNYVVQKWNGSKWVDLTTLSNTDSTYTESGLVCNGKYYYRVKSIDNSADVGISYSDSVLVVPYDTVTPSKVSMLYASSITNSKIEVAFSKVSDLRVTLYEIYQSTNGGIFSKVATLTSTGASTYKKIISGLDLNANTYAYKVLAIDSCGGAKSKYFEVHQTTKVKATSKNLSLLLNWSKYIGFTSKNYILQKWNGSTYIDLYTSLSGTDTSYLDTGLACKSTYKYRVKAIESGGDLQFSFSDSTVGIPFDTIAPDGVNVLYASVKTNSTVEISFNKVLAKDVNQYKIYQSTNGGAYSLIKSVTATAASNYTITQSGLTTNANIYAFRVYAVDSCAANTSHSTETHELAKLQGISQNLSNLLKWKQYKGFNVKNYILQKWNGSTFVDLYTSTSSTDTSYLDTGLACKTLYKYRVKSVENNGDLQFSYSDSLALTPFDTTKPDIVNILYASVVSKSSIEIAFNKVAAKDVNLYKIYQSTNGGVYTLLKNITSTGASSYKYISTGLNTNTNIYSFRVFAVDSCASNTSPASQTHEVVKIGGIALNLSNLLKWKGYKGFTVKNYEVEKLSSGTWTSIYTSTGATDTSFTDQPLGCNIAQTYRIKAIESAGDLQSALSDTITLTPFDTIKPNIPVIKYATLTNDKKIHLEWAKVVDKDVNRYIIWEKKNSASIFSAIDTVYKDSQTTISYKSNILEPICFKVSALDSCKDNVSPASLSHCTGYLTVQTNKCNQSILLKWSIYQGFSSTVKYNVYRKINSGSESLYKSLASPRDSFTDFGVSNLNSYTYRVEALDGKTGSTFSSFTNSADTYTFKPLTPQIFSASKTITSNIGGRVVLKWKKQDVSPDKYIASHDVFYRKYPSTIWTLLQANIPTKTDSVVQNGLDTRFANYDYAIVSKDSCGNISDTSTIHTTMELKMTVGQLTHELFWTSYKGFTVNKYYVQNLQGTKWIQTDTVDGSLNYKKRIPVACNTPVYYRIMADDGFGHQALSDTAGGQAIDTIPSNKPKLTNASVLTSKSVQLNFVGSDSADTYKYSILRQDNSGSFNTVTNILYTGAAKTYTNIDKVNTQIDYHKYLIVTFDSCLNATFSDTFATIQLEGKAQNLQNRLWWKPFNGYSIDSYFVDEYISGKWNRLANKKSTDSNFVHANLLCNSKHIYQVWAKEKSGARITFSDSIVLSPFDTSKPVPVTIKYASVLPGAKIYVEWNTGGVKVKTYDVLISSFGNPYRKILTTNQLNATFSGFNVLDSTYSIEIIANDSCSGRKSDASPPHTLIQLYGTAMNQSSDLKWTAYKGLGTISKQYIYKNVLNNWVKYDSITSTATSYTDKNQPCTVRQYYRIGALDNTGKVLTFSDTVTTVPFDTIKPKAPEIRYVSVLSTSSIKIKYDWKDADVKYFDIYRSDNGGSFSKINTVIRDSVFIDKSVSTHSNTYRYYVVAIDSCSGSNISQPSDSDENITVNLKTGGCKPFVTVNWTSYKTFKNGVGSYIITRYDPSNSPSIVGTVSGSLNTFTDKAVVETIQYTYRVVALESTTGIQSYSDTFSLQPSIYPRPKSIEMKVATISATGLTNGSVDLRWNNKVSGDTFVYSYRIYHSNSKSSGYSLLYTETDTSRNYYTHFNTNTLSNNHFYYVTPINRCNTEAFIIDTHKVIMLTLKNGNLMTTLNWNKYEGFPVKNYYVYKKIGTGIYQRRATLSNIDTQFVDSNIRCKVDYSYFVSAEDLGTGIISKSNERTFIGKDSIPPSKADILSASVGVTDGSKGAINLKFKSAKEANRAGYTIYRMSTPSSSSFTPIKTVKDTSTGIVSYTDGNIDTKNETFSYFIISTDSCGNNGVASDTHTVINLKAAAFNDYNKIGWSNYIGFKNWNYKIERRTVGSSVWIDLGTEPNDSTAHFDPYVNCFVRYEYRITGQEIGTSNIAYSNTDTCTAFEINAPAVPVMKNVTVTKTGAGNGEVLVEWKKSISPDVANYILYRSEDGINFKQTAVLSGDTSYYDKNLNTYNFEYYYKVAAVDTCKNYSIDNTDIHKSILLKAKNGNQEVLLKWKNYKGWLSSKVELLKNGITIQTFIPDASGNVNDSFLDTLVLCRTFYKYEIVAYDFNNIQISHSNFDSLIAIDNKAPRPIHLLTATVSDDDKLVTISWVASTNFDAVGYILYRKKLPFGASEVIYKGTNPLDTSFVDSTFGEKGQYCYSLQVYDGCNNGSKKSNMGCIMELFGKSNSLSHTLTWNPYSEWKNGVSRYNIYRKEDDSLWVLIDNIPGTETSYTDEKLSNDVQNHCYKVEAIENSGYLASSKSFTVCLVQAPIVWMPNSFSPTISVGLNDGFGPGGTYFKKFNMTIYDRWGELIYQTTDGTKWDGKFNGEYVEEGIYIYEIYIKGFEETEIRKKGTITIIR